MLLTSMGWTSSFIFEFYITAIASERLDSPQERHLWHRVVLFGLFAQSILGVPLASELRRVYNMCGNCAVNMSLFACALYVVRMVLLLTRNPWVWCLVLISHCLCTLITTNAPYLWLDLEKCGGMDSQMLARHRGFFTGSLNVTCPLGTVAAGLTSVFAFPLSASIIPSQVGHLFIGLAVCIDRCRRSEIESNVADPSATKKEPVLGFSSSRTRTIRKSSISVPARSS